jgi:NAD(P)-dependent dehydrogenase (short-subunit alcohol dehydrogenase family)
MKLKNKAILITGASQGLGKEIASACLKAGANIAICARTAELLEATRVELAEAFPDRRIVAQIADVSHAEDVDRVVDTTLTSFGRLDGLVNNAGVYGPIGPVEEVEWKVWREAIETNLFGTVLFCRAAMRVFRSTGRGKIVNLSGGGATAPLPRFSSYAASKAAVVRFTETLAEECSGTGIDVNSVAPGALNTRLLQQVLDAGPELSGPAFHERALKQQESGGAPLSKGSQLCVFLLSDESNGITGRLLSAIWDPWMDLPSHLEELRLSEVYTLRRIVPKDRGLNWDDPA